MNRDEQFNLVLKQCETINLKKLKVDTFLLVIHFLLKDFKKMQTDITPDPMTICASKEELTFINNSVSSLQIYLEKNIIVSDTLFSIFKNRTQTPLFNKIARNLEPMKAYYKYLINIFSAKLQNGDNWIPELLAFSLIYNYKKEHNKSFVLYPAIDNFPIDKIVNIYNKNNLELKKRISEERNLSIWKIKTDIDKMYDTSELMVQKYLTYSFKINEKRVSKTRNKRKR